MGSIRQRLNTIKHNDRVTVTDRDGNEVSGKIKAFTPSKVIIEVVEYVGFDAKEVKIEKDK